MFVAQAHAEKLRLELFLADGPTLCRAQQKWGGTRLGIFIITTIHTMPTQHDVVCLQLAQSHQCALLLPLPQCYQIKFECIGLHAPLAVHFHLQSAILIMDGHVLVSSEPIHWRDMRCFFILRPLPTRLGHNMLFPPTAGHGYSVPMTRNRNIQIRQHLSSFLKHGLAENPAGRQTTILCDQGADLPIMG